MVKIYGKTGSLQFISISVWNYLARFIKDFRVLQSVQKETQTFKLHFFLVKIIDCKNDIISVSLPFNKELNSKVLS